MYEHKYLQDVIRPTFCIMAVGTTAINIKAMPETFKNGPCLIKCDKPPSPDVHSCWFSHNLLISLIINKHILPTKLKNLQPTSILCLNSGLV
jgi:hypothetical protein